MLPNTEFISFITLLSLLFYHNFIKVQAIENDNFEAAFQGECHISNPCQQLCFDLHDGTFECACHDGFHLNLNGYSCYSEF